MTAGERGKAERIHGREDELKLWTISRKESDLESKHTYFFGCVYTQTVYRFSALCNKALKKSKINLEKRKEF